MKPSRVIRNHSGEPYLNRWYVIPRNRWCNIYLHHILKSDDDRALHDHPWRSLSFLLWGSLSEVYAVGQANHVANQWWRTLPWLRPVFRSAKFSHRLVVPEGKTAWTLFITGPRIRKWGFHCPGGWKFWADYEQAGGCGDD